MIKVDLITGFLGSGKTTFIKKYVRYLLDKGEKIGIIENDYGAINVDMLLLNREFGDECGMEMVVAADPDCHRRRFKTKLIAMGMDGVNDGKYDRIIVEPSGIYDVDEFFDILYEEPLDRFYEIGNVIAIVDAGLSDELSKESDYLLVSQIAEAGMVVFSKVGGELPTRDETMNGDKSSVDDNAVNEKELSDGSKAACNDEVLSNEETAKLRGDNVENVIAHMNRTLERFKCDRRYELYNKKGHNKGALCKKDRGKKGVYAEEKEGADDNGIGEESNGNADGFIDNMQKDKHMAEDIMIKPWNNLTADDFERIESCGYVPEDHIKMRVTEANGYRSLFYYHVRMSEGELKTMAAGLFADESFGNILRIKGFVPDKETEDGSLSHPSILQGACAGDSEGNGETSPVSSFIEINATRKQTEITHTDKGQEVIIVIGEDLDNAKIEEYIRSFSHEKDITAGQSNHSHAHS